MEDRPGVRHTSDGHGVGPRDPEPTGRNDHGVMSRRAWRRPVGEPVRTVLAGVLGAMLALMAGEALAGSKRALVLAVQGKLAPQVQAYDQMDEAAELRLDAEARLTFAHYVLCQVVALRGPGTVEILGDDFAWRGPQPPETRPGKCVGQVSYLDPDAQTAGISLRAAGGIEIGTRPVLVVQGFDRARALEISIERVGGESRTLRLSLDAAVVSWPEGVPPLEAGAVYRLTLIRGKRASELSVSARVGADDGPTGGRTPLILAFR